ncbi:aminoacyl-tRNA hydrolase [Phenylobacterium sp.]|uniref:aminoacyl-tRNA hydrolase n=1 Tax=Phenylobacterium sp. TaxID=1871053 RepID=UPI001201F0F8|nr:aminoacyl-tRNA hydrolase [Phenylobacterium sp.]THD56881.1 MAG: aminoacyl-tRNA hydrolase [Phenylobacterium sp.]
MLLIAGLGNPGPTYAKTRHNIGFMAVDEIARRWGFGPWRSRFQGFAAEGSVPTPDGPAKILILKPQTFYNESGRAVGEALKFFKIEPENLIVFYDEIDLAPGRFRMKAGGGAAGNNGVRSITSQVGPYYRRARLGTGHPGQKELVHGHVLSEFHKADQQWVAPLIEACAEALPLLAAGEDEKYQTEVMRLAPADKVDPRKAARGEL